MRLTLKRGVIYFFIFFLCSCQEHNSFFVSSKNINKELKLKKIKVFKLKKNDSLKDKKIGRIRLGFVKLPNKNIYAFFDEIFNRFLITDGSQIYSIFGGKGRGPREFLRVLSYNLSKDKKLIVYDGSLKTFKVFNLKGKLLNTFKINSDTEFSIASPFIFPIDKKFYTGIVKIKYLANLEDIWKSPLIGAYNKTGILVDTLGEYDKYIKNVNTYSIFPVINFIRKKHLFLSTQKSSYRIQIYDLDSEKRVAYFGYKSKHFKETEKPIEPMMPKWKIKRRSINQSFAMGIYFTDKYIILSFQNLSAEWFKTNNKFNKKYFLAVYNRSTKDFVDEISLPLPLANIVDNKIYLLENGNPVSYTLGVYKIEN